MKDILEKNLLILASAGSGKTYQLGNRVIGKIGKEEVEPERMVALTFTRKAAGEFADSVLLKLAEGSLDAEKGQQICADVKGQFEVAAVLEKVVKALPRLQLTTLDGFFSRIVRGFQYELGLSGGTFDLLEGERLKTAQAEILQGVLADGFRGRSDFFHAFRKSTLGRGEQGVQRSLEDFVDRWHQIWKSGVRKEAFGNAEVFGDLPKVDDWLAKKDGFIAALRDESKPKVWNVMLANFDAHTVGKNLKLNTFGRNLLEAIDESVAVEILDRKKPVPFTHDEWTRWQALFRLAIHCEIASAVAKTQAVGVLMEQVDHEHEQQLRRRGLLSFDDVKVLLGEWSQNEEARVARELVDYRLDGRYDHWLLDEFQDTSRAEWCGLEPLIDEAVADGEGSFFVVGDRKQGIYAWRGGDVSLFDQVRNRYGEGLQVEPMDVSYRSCPAVLALVNAVCGDLPMIGNLFGKSVQQEWEWQNHESAPSAQKSGEAKVVEVAKGQDGEILVEELKRLGIGEKKLSCGVLVRTGAQVKKYADLLRAEGFDVIEAGVRDPGMDHAVGVVILHLVKWLADPADSFSREVMTMSPLMEQFDKYGEHWGTRWDRMMREIQKRGYARFVSSLIAPEWEHLKLYGRRRAEDLIAALADFDATGEACPRAAADHLRDLQVTSAPGVAAIQVMTIHKSKGLGFDVVMLPELPDRSQVPDATKFSVARGRDWLLQAPGKWAYLQYPETKAAYERWGETQKYETLCLLYVALTRAKRGLYVYLPEEPKSRKEKKTFATPANLVRQTTGIVFPESNENWTDSVEDAQAPEVMPVVTLPKGKPLRGRSHPSGLKKFDDEGAEGGRVDGRRIGKEVHRLFEKIGWLSAGELPRQPFTQAGKIVEDTLKVPRIHAVFEGQGAELFREQAIELIYQGRWMSGVVDRLHVYREGGEVIRIEVIDFKSDFVKSEKELSARYAGSMMTYQGAVAQIYGIDPARVECRLVSTVLGKVVEMKEVSVQGELDL